MGEVLGATVEELNNQPNIVLLGCVDPNELTGVIEAVEGGDDLGHRTEGDHDGDPSSNPCGLTQHTTHLLALKRCHGTAHRRIHHQRRALHTADLASQHRPFWDYSHPRSSRWQNTPNAPARRPSIDRRAITALVVDPVVTDSPSSRDGVRPLPINMSSRAGNIVSQHER